MKTYKEFRKSIGFPLKERKVEDNSNITRNSLKEDVIDQLRLIVKKKKEMDIKLPSYATKPIKDMINKYKKNNKIKGDISDDLKKQAIKKHMNRKTKKPHAEEYTAAITGGLGRGQEEITKGL